MGFFGGLISRIERTIDNVKEKVKDVGRTIKNKVTNQWNKFTGKDSFEKADKLYEKITTKYNERRRQFELEVQDYTNKIEDHVDIINKSKEKIKQKLFPEMAHKLENIKDISVSEDFIIEEYIKETLSFDSVRSKSELYKIDFNKHKVKTTIQAIFTLGFYTRKKAKETLYAVQEEEGKINNEIAKMDAEIVKLSAIEQSLDNVENYFVALIELYENLLVRLDNSVKFLYVRCLSFARKLVNEEMSIKKLPVMQQKEIEAIITSSKILKVMTDANIMSIEDREAVITYSNDMEKQYAEMKKVYEAA